VSTIVILGPSLFVIPSPSLLVIPSEARDLLVLGINSARNLLFCPLGINCARDLLWSG